MANDYVTGTQWSSTLPTAQRQYYESVLMQTIRTKSLMVPFCAVKEDFSAQQTGKITYSEVYDTEPNFNSLSEQDIWLRGAYLDTRSVTLDLEIHGDTLKYSDYNELTNYLNSGNLRGLMKDKIGQNLSDTLDILARNAYLDHPYPVLGGGARADRASILATDLFDPDYAEEARTQLEENDIPGIGGVNDGDGQTIVCVTTPRVIHDIRVGAGSGWLDVQQYVGTQRKFTNEVGTWAGTRFVRTNRLVLPNAGRVAVQTTLSADTVVGQGAAATVDKVYQVGQAASVRTVPVAATTGFEVGQKVTIHDQALTSADAAPLETDGSSETRRIVAIGTGTLTFDKPLLKAHKSGDFVTTGLDLHASIFMGGPAVVWGIGERPTPVLPPKFDDMMMINRTGWRGFFKFQQFRPEFIKVYLNAGSK
jgi:N4-gp56 family major capsid protein